MKGFLVFLQASLLVFPWMAAVFASTCPEFPSAHRVPDPSACLSYSLTENSLAKLIANLPFPSSSASTLRWEITYQPTLAFGKLEIVEGSKLWSTNSSFDYEALPSSTIELILEFSEDGFPSCTCDLRLFILDVNEGFSINEELEVSVSEVWALFCTAVYFIYELLLFSSSQHISNAINSPSRTWMALAKRTHFFMSPAEDTQTACSECW